MDILVFPLIRRHTTTKHVNQLINNNARYTSQAEAAAPRHTVPNTSDALLAPRRPHAHARARVNLFTTDASCTSKLYRFIPYSFTRL